MTPERIPIRVGATESVVWVGSGLLDDAAERLESPSGRYVLVSSAGSRAAADRVRGSLSGKLLADVEIDDAESAKTLAAAGAIADRALEGGIRRDDAFVAVGGGVVTDVAGFAAAIVLRGVAWNAVPTTVAGMADAAIGGKTGVDHRLGKNLIGAFHLPRAVLVDPAAAMTLSDRDYRSGLVEAFKAAWIRDPELSRRAAARVDSILARDPAALLDLVAGAVRVKADIVSSDLTEVGRRRLLNFGHTLGHALEAAEGYGHLRHGEAVAWGIAAALEISRRRAGLSEGDAAAISGVLGRLGPFPRPKVSGATLAPLLARDKKATARGVAGVLLESLGRARVEESIPVEEWIRAAAAVIPVTEGGS
ncbi:MAG TPA: 3-dehydroquinate synthase family protein [Thermoanaerobaculia bacterium]|nr:3-dehydroquinate synthase family protein [Thermoanaerobaculia bacterium]